MANDIKDEVGDFVTTSILDYVGEGKSPVTGRSFPKLSKAYANEEKGGRTLPNLDLNGDMLNALTFKKTDSGVEVGIFDSEQAPKAYNHNVGDTLPQRQFIADPKQNFVGDIQKGINDIVNKRIVEAANDESTDRQDARTTPSDFGDTEDVQDVTVQSGNILTADDDAFKAYLGGGSLKSLIKNILDGK